MVEPLTNAATTSKENGTSSCKGVSNKLLENPSRTTVLGEYSSVMNTDADMRGVMDKQIETLLQMNEKEMQTDTAICQNQRSNSGSSLVNKLFSESPYALVGLSSKELCDSETKDTARAHDSVEQVASGISSSANVDTSSNAQSVSDTAGAESESSETQQHTYKLLAVDDSRVIRRLIVKTMVGKGHTCDEAEDGIDGVNKVKAQLENGGITYDAILMDFVMPNMDGPTATKAIRDLGVTIPILGLTGNCLPRDVEWFIECGATAVMFKPLNVKEFDEHMNNFVTSRRD